MDKGVCWKSNLDFHHERDETESQSSSNENYGDLKESSAGPFMLNLFKNQLYTDVEFVFKSTGECLCAHRVVLAAKCEFFADLLFGEKTNNVCRMKMQIEISNVPFAVFKDIVNYFYTDDIDFPDLSTVLDIRTTANSFKIQALMQLCEQYLDELELNEDNVCSTLQISRFKCMDSLKRRCIDYIKNHATEVISSPDFEKCSYNTVREISELQDLNLRSESEMLEAVSRWIDVQPDHVKVELRKSLMKCIRFLSFTPNEFHDVIKQYPMLLTSGEALDTLIYLNDPTPQNMKGLPKWMNKNRRKFSPSMENLRLTENKVKMVGKLEIPLTTVLAQMKLDRLKSFLQLKCIKGAHKINGIKIKLEDISNAKDTVAVIVVKAVVKSKHNNIFSKTIDSKEVVVPFFNNILLSSGQTFLLEIEIVACQSCKFFQFDNSKKAALTNEHFQCSVASKPKLGMLYLIHEVLYENRTENVASKKTECPPKESKSKRKRKKKAEQNQEVKGSVEKKKGEN